MSDFMDSTEQAETLDSMVHSLRVSPREKQAVRMLLHERDFYRLALESIAASETRWADAVRPIARRALVHKDCTG